MPTKTSVLNTNVLSRWFGDPLTDGDFSTKVSIIERLFHHTVRTVSQTVWWWKYLHIIMIWYHMQHMMSVSWKPGRSNYIGCCNSQVHILLGNLCSYQGSVWHILRRFVCRLGRSKINRACFRNRKTLTSWSQCWLTTCSNDIGNCYRSAKEISVQWQ